MMSNWATFLPQKVSPFKKLDFRKVIKIGLIIIFFVQLILFSVQSSKLLIERTHRMENKAEIEFYNLAMPQLKPLEAQSVYAYYDYRLYMPEKENWVTETSFDLLDYQFIETRNFDVLFLLQQRIKDYLHPSAVGVDSEAFERSQTFYRDADDGKIEGYQLHYRNETALLYIRDDICENYFDPGNCQ